MRKLKKNWKKLKRNRENQIFHRIAAVNQLSREIVEGKYTIEEAEKKLEEIKKEPGKSDISRMLASGVGSGGFCYLLGGQAMDMLAAFLSGFLLYVVLLAFEKREKTTSKIVLNMIGGFCYLLGGQAMDMLAAFLSGFLLYVVLLAFEKREKTTSKIVLNMIGGFCVSLFAVIFYRMGLGNAPGSILVGSVMPLVPGVSLVNAVRDFAEGNYIGGGVRFLDALMVALGIALGVSLMHVVYFRMTGGSLL